MFCIFVGCIEPKRRTRIVDRAARTAAQRERSRNIYVRRWDGIMGREEKKEEEEEVVAH